MQSQRGFLSIVLGIILLLAIGGSTYYFLSQKKNDTPQPKQKTEIIVPTPAPTNSSTNKPTPSPTIHPSTSKPVVNPTPTPLHSPVSTPSPTPNPTPIAAMTFSGVAQVKAGEKAPAGLPVYVLINNINCGGAVTSNEQVNFYIEVDSATTRAGCGTPGATMTFTINGQKAQQTMPFNPGHYSSNVVLNVYY